VRSDKPRTTGNDRLHALPFYCVFNH
jgi:hypothetical protein